jgi:hypothetical protein
MIWSVVVVGILDIKIKLILPVCDCHIQVVYFIVSFYGKSLRRVH